MRMAKPILVIQMQRMGDLILSFPLILWLRRTFPAHPVWVLAEPKFFGPLRGVSPAVRYVEYGQRTVLERERFFLVINLSHRAQGCALAGAAHSEDLLGGYEREGVLRIAGVWQEYRASLVHNNRHNRFHWADMNALDVIPRKSMAATHWPRPRELSPSVRKIGVFVGASEPDKRPDARFWADLVLALEQRRFVPVLLGGPAEKPLCREIRTLAGRPVANACGTLGLDQFAFLGQDLAALITPDTGPMHLAAWTGLRVLNVSMGPVHAWETGPYQPGHVILRAARDCVGCWRCRFSRPRCHAAFTPGPVVRALEALLRGGPRSLEKLKLPGLEILGTGRDAYGLYTLRPLVTRVTATEILGAYWQRFWMHALSDGDDASCLGAAERLWRAYPLLARNMVRAATRFLQHISSDADIQGRDWNREPLHLRPLSGFAATHLANHDYLPSSRLRIRELARQHLEYLTTSRC